MAFTRQKFSQDKNQDFFNALRRNVNDYFESTNRSKYANANMKFKTIFMFSLYLAPYILMYTGLITNPVVFVLLWIVMGLGMSGIGLSVMHDANHGSYSKNPLVNRILGHSLNVIGANAELWKLQHNVLHHTYTNVQGVDEDIDAPGFLRFSPYIRRRWIHKFQFLYFWFFYGLQTMPWITTKEFMQLVRYRKMGLIKTEKKFNSWLIQSILWKIFYYTYMLVLPMIFFPFSWWVILIGFFSLHFTTSLILSLIFQTAHVMPSCTFTEPDDSGTIKENWAVHEMMTTTNYAPRSRVFSWFIGGLNYQVEHHLFSNICHVHYRKLSKIVEQTANEYGIPYNMEKSFFMAIVRHVQLLYRLGRTDSLPATA